MTLIDIIEVIHLQAPRLTLYHETCYVPITKPTDIVIRLLSVPSTWIDPGCVVCGTALAVSPFDEQIEHDFWRTMDKLEAAYVAERYAA